MITTLIAWFTISCFLSFYLLFKLWNLMEDVDMIKFAMSNQERIVNKQIEDTEIWLEDLEEQVETIDFIQNAMLDSLSNIYNQILKDEKKESWKKSTTKKV